MKTRLEISTILLILTALLAPIFGGYVLNDQTTLGPGLGELITGALGGSDAPLTSHFLIALPALIAFILLFARRKIVQVPNQTLIGAVLLFFFFVISSLPVSSFRIVTASTVFEWLMYGFAFFAVVGGAGRLTGPQAILSAFGAGSGIISAKCILEYASMRASNPSWRVFGGWVNPNATAAMLLIGFFCCIAVGIQRDRLERLLAVAGASLILFAMVLTGSKGAVSLALPIGTIILCLGLSGNQQTKARFLVYGLSFLAFGVIAFCFLKNIGYIGLLTSLLVGAIALVSSGSKDQIGKVVSPFIVGACLLALLTVTTPKAASGDVSTPIGRVASGGATTQDQSATFRLNLWKSAGSLIKERPIFGYGMGTYRYESGRPGLTTLTIFAHNVYLQLWAESGFGALASFIGILALWLGLVLKNFRSLAQNQRVMLSGILAAVGSLLVHALVDSDLYYFGIGMSVFMLLGLGLLVSNDSVAPEFVPKPLRALAVSSTVLAGLMLLFFAQLDTLKSNFRYYLRGGDGQGAIAAADPLATYAGFDGDAALYVARVKQGSERTALLKQAFELQPTGRIARELAADQARNNQAASGAATLRDSLRRDPNNLNTLMHLLQLQITAGDKDEAISTAKRMVAIEATPYFQIRSLADLVPTETYTARFLVLADSETDPKKQADTLREGVQGMMSYATTTAPIVIAETKKDPTFAFAGSEDIKVVLTKMKAAKEAADKAAAIYKKLGDKDKENEMEQAAQKLNDLVPADLIPKT